MEHNVPLLVFTLAFKTGLTDGAAPMSLKGRRAGR
jgi:hypothetical protein